MTKFSWILVILSVFSFSSYASSSCVRYRIKDGKTLGLSTRDLVENAKARDLVVRGNADSTFGEIGPETRFTFIGQKVNVCRSTLLLETPKETDVSGEVYPANGLVSQLLEYRIDPESSAKNALCIYMETPVSGTRPVYTACYQKP